MKITTTITTYDKGEPGPDELAEIKAELLRRLEGDPTYELAIGNEELLFTLPTTNDELRLVVPSTYGLGGVTMRKCTGELLYELYGPGSGDLSYDGPMSPPKLGAWRYQQLLDDIARDFRQASVSVARKGAHGYRVNIVGVSRKVEPDVFDGHRTKQPVAM